MKEILNVNIPESLADVTTDQLVRYLKSESHEIPKVFSIFCDIRLDVLKVMDNKTVHYIYSEIAKALNQNTEDIKPTYTFVLDGVEYGMIPNLEDITFGEFIDLDTFITPAYEGDIKHEDAFRFLATLYRPIVKKANTTYSIAEYTGKEDWSKMKKVPADIYLGAVSFFLRLRVELWRASLIYMEVVAQQADEQNLTSDGDGTEASSHFRQLISARRKQLQDLESSKHLTNWNLWQSLEPFQN